MARIALIDPVGRAVTTVEAVLGRTHDIVVRPRIHAPGDVELVIADLRPAELADHATLRALASFGPVLLLVDRMQPIPPAVEESTELYVLRKPFDAFELRLRVDKLLEAARSAYDRPQPMPGRDQEDAAWLEFPLVPAPAGAVLRRGARLSAPLWILGEPGVGRRRIALAVCRVSRPSPRVVTVFPDERLEHVLLREHGEAPYALIVPEIERRPLVEQERLAAILAGPRDFRLICTSVDDPAEQVLAGEFSRNLYQHLIGLAVQVPPLRERPITIPPLVQALSRSIMRSMGSVGEISFSPDAMARLQTYMWPGNIVELESVLVRTLTMIGEVDAGGRTVEARELLFTPEGSLFSSATPRSGGEIARLPVQHEGETRAPRRDARAAAMSEDEAGQVTPDEESAQAVPGARRATTLEALLGERAGHAVDAIEQEPVRTDQGANIEDIVAGLAHDLRNPMVAIKTFAGVLSAGKTESESARELGSLASDACDRIGGYLEALQAYSGFGSPAPTDMDLLDCMRAVVAELDANDSGRVWIEAEGEAPLHADREQIRFALEHLLAVALAEAGDGRTVRVYTTPPREVPRVGAGAQAGPKITGAGALVFEIAAGRGPVAKLRKFVRSESGTPSWRVLLARTLAERNGCDVDVEFAEDAVRIRCLLPGGEEKARGEQTNRSSS